MFSAAPRRIAAVVLPLLASEVARATSPALAGSSGGASGAARPLAILIDGHGPEQQEEGSRTIDAVDEAAHARGVRPGQKVSEAAALTAGLVVVRVAARAIESALARVADVAFSLGPLVAIGPPDTVWVDVTGAAHLWGDGAGGGAGDGAGNAAGNGEPALLAELEERVRALGHRARGAIAEGPRLARALARFAQHAGAARIAPDGRGAEAVAMLPVRALVEEPAVILLLGKLGVRTVADLARLPAAAAAARLGDAAQDILALAQGRDPAPLLPYVPPSRVTEEVALEDGVESAVALVFVARGLVSRAAARLVARGQAASRIDLELLLDRSIVLLRAQGRVDDGGEVPMTPLALARSVGAANDVAQRPPVDGARGPARELVLAIDLPAPLGHETDLLRAIKAKIEALVLPAPVVAVRLVLSRIAPAPEVQLAMGDASTPVADPDALAALLSELSAEIGPARLGVFVVHDDHRPEARSALEPPRLDPPRAASTASAARAEKVARAAFGARARDFEVDLLPSPTRLLAARPTLGKVGAPLVPGATVMVGRRRFVIEKVAFDRRVDGARWWTPAPAARDYLRVCLRAEAGRAETGSAASVEAWVYVDRRTGEAVLHGLWE